MEDRELCRRAALCSSRLIAALVLFLAAEATPAFSQDRARDWRERDSPPAGAFLPEGDLDSRAALITAPFEAPPEGPQAPSEAVSLFQFNPERAARAIRSREKFFPLYMGIKEREGRTTELLALRILLGDPEVGIACERVRKSLEPDRGTSRRREAEAELAGWLTREARRPGFADRYLSYSGEGGRVDPDFLIYTTPYRWLAGFYGEVIFEIRESPPRGIDLNSYNREVVGYYDGLDWRKKLNPKDLLIRGVFDRDEYVIPSHIPGREIVAAEIRARIPGIPGRAVKLTGRLQRRYERHEENGASWVDLMDRRGKPIARFTLDAAVPAPQEPRSSHDLPQEIEESASHLTIRGLPVLLLR